MNSVKSLWDMWAVFWDNMQSFVEFFTQPMSNAVNSWLNSPFAPIAYITSLPFVKDIIQRIVDSSFLGSVSLAEFMLGGGIVTIVVVSIIKWIIGIIM